MESSRCYRMRNVDSKFASTSLMRFVSSVVFCGTLIVCIVGAAFVSAQQRQTGVLQANDFPGGDLGAKINAADRALGVKRGEIVIKGGGTISTQVIISSDHV